MADDWLVVGVVVASVLAFGSFVNMVGVHLAVRAIKKRIDRILKRVEKAMDDPIGTAVPLVKAAVERLNDDSELRGHLGGVLTWAGRTAGAAAAVSMKAEFTGEEPAVDKDGKPLPPKKKKGVLGGLMGLLEIGQAFGLVPKMKT